MSKILKAGTSAGDAVTEGSAPATAATPVAAPGLTPGKVLEREVVAAHAGARRILEQAEAQARELLAAARGEAESIRREAAARGEAEGLAAWEERLAELAAAESRLLDEARGQLLQLATRIAEKILRRRLETAPEAILPMVEEALQASRGNVGGRVVLRLNPADADTVAPHLERLLQLNRGFESLELLRDGALVRGGCRVETQFGTIDASVETQLRAIQHLLAGGGKA